MNITKNEQKIEARGGKIFRTSMQEIEIEKSEVIGEINMCRRRIEDAQSLIDSETEKLRVLENIQKETK